MSLKKWIHILSIFIVIIPTHLLCEMQENSPGVEFLRTTSEFTFRRGLFASSVKGEIGLLDAWSCSDGKEMYKKAWCACRVAVLLFKSTAFLMFSFPSLSMDLKVPIIWEVEYVSIFVNNTKWLSKRYLSRNPLKMWTNVWPIISITCGKKRQ